MSSVSVVITTHNRAHFLMSAIESARSAGTSLELIVVDDASTDRTCELCDPLPDIRYVRLRTNGGLAHARNVGLAESSSEFIAFLDDDDLRLPGLLDEQLRVLEENADAGFCYGQALLGDANRRLPTGEFYPAECPTGDIFWELLERNFVPMPTVLARKSRLLEAGGFKSELKVVEDWDMWLRLAERFPVVAIEKPVAIHRKANRESGQMCSDSAEMCRQSLRVQQMALSRFRARATSRAKRRQVRQKLLDHSHELLMAAAIDAFHEGDGKSAAVNLREAFRFRPIRTIARGRWPWFLCAARSSARPTV